MSQGYEYEKMLVVDLMTARRQREDKKGQKAHDLLPPAPFAYYKSPLWFGTKYVAHEPREKALYPFGYSICI